MTGKHLGEQGADTLLYEHFGKLGPFAEDASFVAFEGAELEGRALRRLRTS